MIAYMWCVWVERGWNPLVGGLRKLESVAASVESYGLSVAFTVEAMVGVRGIFWNWTFPVALEPL